MNLTKIIHSDSDILGGQVVFVGTRVPVESLFDHLEAGVFPERFLSRFPYRCAGAGSCFMGDCR